MGVNEPDLVALTLAEFGYLEDDKPASTDFGIDLALSTGLLPKKNTYQHYSVVFYTISAKEQ
jgi:hypothetical protein